MPLAILDDRLWFPPLWEAMPDGLLAMGGDLTSERIKLAYQKGIFPWFEGEVPLWWSPNPRFVLYPDHLRVSNSMKQVINSKKFHFSINKAFDQVIANCQQVSRKGQQGTWITTEVRDAYIQLNKEGVAISAECWNQSNQLVGGLYGILMGKVFFGESMFALESNASKFAFIKLTQFLKKQNDLQLVDCQVYTAHLESLGANMISRQLFVQLIDAYISPH